MAEKSLTVVKDAPVGGSMLAVRFTPEEIKEQLQLVDQVYRKVMKKDLHYGIIAGTKQPTLYKPGSELLLSMFRIAVTPRVEDLSTDDCRRYRVFAELTHVPSGQVLGTGVGECSSNESKYKWRAALNQKEFESFTLDRRRIKFGKEWNEQARRNDVKEIMQVRAEMEDVANTCLKIAKKRAQIDGTLTVTHCSDMFKQDLEDMDQATRDQLAEPQFDVNQERPRRETGALRPSQEPNRGHGNEGMKDEQLSKADEKSTTSDSNKATKQSLQQTAPQPETPVGSGPRPDSILAVTVLQKIENKTATNGAEYLRCHFDSGDGGTVVVLNYHKSLFAACAAAVNKPCEILFHSKGNAHSLDDFLAIDGVQYEQGKPKPPVDTGIAPSAEQLGFSTEAE